MRMRKLANTVFYHFQNTPKMCVRLRVAQQAENLCTTSAQRLLRWPNIVQMLYKCFMFTGWCALLNNTSVFNRK